MGSIKRMLRIRTDDDLVELGVALPGAYMAVEDREPPGTAAVLGGGYMIWRNNRRLIVVGARLAQERGG